MTKWARLISIPCYGLGLFGTHCRTRNKTKPKFVPCGKASFFEVTSWLSFLVYGAAILLSRFVAGSENNSLCIYHRAMPKPAVQYKFEAPRESLARTLMKTDGGEFLSAVAWKKVRLVQPLIVTLTYVVCFVGFKHPGSC